MLVVGGGLAGLSAAMVLAERGVKVTVLEKEPRLGGRLAAWPDTLKDGTAFQMERGFHGFFRQYYNLRAIMRRFDPTLSFLQPLADYPLLGPDGAQETFEKLPSLPPFNLLELIRRSPNLPLHELKDVAMTPALAMVSYDPDWTYRRYDGMSAKEYLDSLNFREHARRLLFDVFSHSFFNPEARYSAAELLMNFHFYFLGNPEGLVFDVCTDPFSTTVLEPLGRKLEELGATLECGVGVASLSEESDKVVATLEDGKTVSADSAVLALHVPGLQGLVEASQSFFSSWIQDQVATLAVTDPFYVQRLWLDRPVDRSRPAFAGTSGVGLLDNISVYELFEDESRQWARNRGGSVVELHAYAVPEDRSEASVRDELLQALYGLYPETRGATILDERAFMRRDCPAFEPNSHATRPGVGSAGSRIGLAGDFVRTDVPSALMERAATTGIQAANHVMKRWGTAAEAVQSIPRRGLLSGVLQFAERAGFRAA